MDKIKKSILLITTTGRTQGSWDAQTNIPNISNTSESGLMWYVSRRGGTQLGKINSWEVGDWVVRNKSGWGRIRGSELPPSNNIIHIIPDTSKSYHMKIGLYQNSHDLGFFDALAILG